MIYRAWKAIHPVLMLLGAILMGALVCASLAAMQLGVLGSLPLFIVSLALLCALLGGIDSINHKRPVALQEHKGRRF